MGRPAKPINETTYAGRFAARLRALREKRRMTGEAMASAITAAGFPCSIRTYYDWESGRTQPMLDAIPAIALATRCSARSVFPIK